MTAGTSTRKASGEASDARIDVLAATVATRLNRILDVLDNQLPEPAPEPVDDWRMYANCAFTYLTGIKHSTEEPMWEHRDSIRRLRKLCSDCPVKVECVGFADDAGIKFGVWGGLTWQQRKHRT